MSEAIYRQIILNNGEEIICQVLETSRYSVEITRVMKLLVQYVDDDRYTGLTPFFSCTPDLNINITLNANSIVATCVPHESLKALYLSTLNEYNEDDNIDLPSNVVSFTKPPDDILH